MKIVTILGARPQFIKAGIVSRALKEKDIEEVIVHTGQHYDPAMSDIFFQEMSIPKPAYNLDINNLSHGAMTGRMLEQIEGVLQKENPAMTLVYGDTNSTLAGALASVKLHIPVAHIEAGLRSFNMKMPEEINRIVTDRVSKMLFCPTATAVTNLVNEGYGEMDCTIVQAGDVMYDTLLYYKDQAVATSTLVKKLGLEPGGFALATVHRAENTDHPQQLQNITEALLQINDTMPVVWPIHPRTRKKIGAMANLDKLVLIEPTGYFDMLSLLNHARLVLTDSGGLQKEAYMMKKFCITLRDQTEWTELVNARVNVIASHDKEKIAGAFSKLKDKAFPAHEHLYGDGQAAQVIVDHILQNAAL